MHDFANNKSEKRKSESEEEIITIISNTNTIVITAMTNFSCINHEKSMHVIVSKTKLPSANDK